MTRSRYVIACYEHCSAFSSVIFLLLRFEAVYLGIESLSNVPRVCEPVAEFPVASVAHDKQLGLYLAKVPYSIGEDCFVAVGCRYSACEDVVVWKIDGFYDFAFHV